MYKHSSDRFRSTRYPSRRKTDLSPRFATSNKLPNHEEDARKRPIFASIEGDRLSLRERPSAASKVPLPLCSSQQAEPVVGRKARRVIDPIAPRVEFPAFLLPLPSEVPLSTRPCPVSRRCPPLPAETKKMAVDQAPWKTFDVAPTLFDPKVGKFT